MVSFSLARQIRRPKPKAAPNHGRNYARSAYPAGDDSEEANQRGQNNAAIWACLSVLLPVLSVGINAQVLLVLAVCLPFGLWLYRSNRIAVDYLDHDGDFTLSQRLAYRVDYSFSVVPYVKAVTLMILTGALIMSSGMAIYLTSDDSLAESLWEATAGVGLDWTFVGDDDSSSYRVRTIGVLTNIGGLVVTALLLGIVSDAVSMYLDNLRKGSCRVVENNFTLVIGWSSKTIPMIEQIAKANISEKGGVVVILAERPKEEIEVDISANESKIGALGTRVVCRAGSALTLSDLRKVSVSNARSIVVLADPFVSEDQSDVRSIRILLSIISALKSNEDKKPRPSSLKVTVEVCNSENAPLIRSIDPSLIEPVIANGVIGRLLVHTARQPEVESVWETLLGFDDCEFYFQNWPDVENLTFGEVLYRFREAVPLGIRREGKGSVILNPTDDTLIERGDEILVLAEDDDSYVPEKLSLFEPDHYSEDDLNSSLTDIFQKKSKSMSMRPARFKKLLIGWRRDIANLVQVLDKLLLPGSEFHILSDLPVEFRERYLLRATGGVADPSSHLKVVHHVGDAKTRKDLEKLDLASYSSIVVSTFAGDAQQINVEDRDSQSIVTLLLVQEILKTSPSTQDVVVVGEIQDPRSRRMILDSSMAQAIIATNDLIAKSLAMVSEDSHVNRVLEDLFNVSGNEIQVVDCSLYIKNGEVLSFFEVMNRVRSARSIAIGYRRGNGELKLNPEDKLVPLTWTKLDRLVTLSYMEQDFDLPEI